jgi:hypothetical protein
LWVLLDDGLVNRLRFVGLTLVGFCQWARLDAQTGPRATIRGIAFDSLTARPLVGAHIEMARVVDGNVERATVVTSGSGGRFETRDLPYGRYLVVLRDASLDTLGIENNETLVDVNAPDVSVSLTTPSASSLRRGVCPDATAKGADSSSLLLGHVFEADGGAAVHGGSVEVFFVATKIERGELTLEERVVTATTSSAGWFAVCSLPQTASLMVRAAKARDTTGLLEVKIPPGQASHVSLYVPDSHRAQSGSLTGRVHDDAGTPIPNAQVTHTGTYRTTLTDRDGHFTLDSLPDGTQSFGVRAIGFSPSDVAIRILSTEITHAEFALERVTTLPAVVTTANGELTGLAAFDHNRRSAASGYFIKPPRLVGYPQLQTVSQLIRSLPIVPSDLRHYDPVVFINGKYTTFSVEELETAVDPETILGVEVYPPRRAAAVYRPKMPHPDSPVLSIWTSEPLKKPK